MGRLIDADKLIKDVLDLPNCENGFSDTYDKATIIAYIDEQPTVDAKPIVKCKDCVYCKAYNDVWYLPKKDALVCINDETEVNADDYCSWGERK